MMISSNDPEVWELYVYVSYDTGVGCFDDLAFCNMKKCVTVQSQQWSRRRDFLLVIMTGFETMAIDGT